MEIQERFVNESIATSSQASYGRKRRGMKSMVNLLEAHLNVVGLEDDLIFDSERLNDVNIDETDKENDILVEIEGEHYEEVDGFRNVW